MTSSRHMHAAKTVADICMRVGKESERGAIDTFGQDRVVFFVALLKYAQYRRGSAKRKKKVCNKDIRTRTESKSQQPESLAGGFLTSETHINRTGCRTTAIFQIRIITRSTSNLAKWAPQITKSKMH